MRFDSDDEAAYEACARTLTEQFARWLRTHGVSVDARDAELLPNWRFNYQDGVLDVWTVADVAEFLLDWCPRKLSASPEACKDMPAAVASFVDFLTHTGQLAPPSDPPSMIRRWCERQQPVFVKRMGDPENFGMAKGLVAQAGGFDVRPPRTGGDLAQLLARADRLGPQPVGDVLDRFARQDAHVPSEVAPVRLAGPEQYLAAVAAAPVLRRLRRLAAFCAPGPTLTAKGNLRVADARRLAESLDTDDVVLPNLRSAEDLPGLSRLVEVALAAGVVRRRRGRLVAVARFAQLDDVAAYEKAVHAALRADPFGGSHYPTISQMQEYAVASVPLLLAELLDAGSGGVEEDDLIDLLGELVMSRFSRSSALAAVLVPVWGERFIEELVDLGMVDVEPSDEPCTECDEPHDVLMLTAAGLPSAVELVREAGITVPLRPEPATATPADLAELLGCIDGADWSDDVRTWLAAQPEPAARRASCWSPRPRPSGRRWRSGSPSRRSPNSPAAARTGTRPYGPCSAAGTTGSRCCGSWARTPWTRTRCTPPASSAGCSTCSH